jgi:nicotinamidase-related amidase
MPEDLIHIDPASTALLVMDYQPGILARLDDPDPLLSTVATAIAIVRARGGHVGYVRVAFTDEDLARIPERSPMAPAAGRGAAMHADAPETQVHGRLAPHHGDIVVRKTRVGAFSTTDLDQQLRDRGITTLMLAGIATSGVVLSTIRDAADRDYRIVVLADACADRDPEVHAFLIEKIFPRQSQVTTVAQLDDMP